MKLNLTKNLITKISLLTMVLITSLALVGRSVYANPGPAFRGGDIFTATNNTKQTPAWTDPLTNVDPGNVVQFRVNVANDGDAAATNTRVSVSVPGTEASSHAVSANISADNASTVGDTVTISGPSSFHFNGLVANDTMIFSNACPAGCLLPDTIISGGVNLGDVAPVSTANNINITFKLYTSPTVAATPTPTPAPTPTPTPTPTPGPTATPAPTATPTPASTPTPAPAAGGQTQTQTQTVNVTQTNNQTVNAAVAPTPAPQVLGVKQLPKTGLPAVAWSALAFIPAGFKLRKFSKVRKDLEDKPSYIWEERQFKAES